MIDSDSMDFTERVLPGRVVSRGAKKKIASALSTIIDALGDTILNDIAVELYSERTDTSIYVTRYPSFINVCAARNAVDEVGEPFKNISLGGPLALVNIDYIAMSIAPAHVDALTKRRSRGRIIVYSRVKEYYSAIVKQARDVARSIRALDSSVRSLINGEASSVAVATQSFKYTIERVGGALRSIGKKRFCSICPPRDYYGVASVNPAVIDVAARGVTIREEARALSRSEYQRGDSFPSVLSRKTITLSPLPASADSVKTYECCGREWTLSISFARSTATGEMWMQVLSFAPLKPPASMREIESIADGLSGIIASIDVEVAQSDDEELYIDTSGEFTVSAENFYSEELKRRFTSGFNTVLLDEDATRELLRARTVQELLETIVSIGEREARG